MYPERYPIVAQVLQRVLQASDWPHDVLSQRPAGSAGRRGRPRQSSAMLPPHRYCHSWIATRCSSIRLRLTLLVAAVAPVVSEAEKNARSRRGLQGQIGLERLGHFFEREHALSKPPARWSPEWLRVRVIFIDRVVEKRNQPLDRRYFSSATSAVFGFT